MYRNEKNILEELMLPLYDLSITKKDLENRDINFLRKCMKIDNFIFPLLNNEQKNDPIILDLAIKADLFNLRDTLYYQDFILNYSNRIEHPFLDDLLKKSRERESSSSWYQSISSPETNIQNLQEIKYIQSRLHELPPKDFEFLFALIKDFEENLENSIFVRYFSGNNFFLHQNGTYSFMCGYKEEWSDDSYSEYEDATEENWDNFAYKIVRNGIFLFNIDLHNECNIVFYNNKYYMFDDEGGMEEVGSRLVDIPFFSLFPYFIQSFSYEYNNIIHQDFNDYKLFSSKYYDDFSFVKIKDLLSLSGNELYPNISSYYEEECFYTMPIILELLEKNYHLEKINIKGEYIISEFNLPIEYDNLDIDNNIIAQLTIKGRTFLIMFNGQVIEKQNNFLKPYSFNLVNFLYRLEIEEITDNEIIIKFLNHSDVVSKQIKYFNSIKNKIYHSNKPNYIWNHLVDIELRKICL